MLFADLTTHDRPAISFVLEQAILSMENNPNGASKISAYDWLSYYDSLHMLKNIFADQQGKVKIISEFTQENLHEGIYALPFSMKPNVTENGMLLAGHYVIFMVIPIADDLKQLGRLLGIHHGIYQNKKIFEKKQNTLMFPFEIVSYVNKNAVAGVSVEYAYQTNPLHAVFNHRITPAPVVGIAVDNQLSSLIGYVVHAKVACMLLGLDSNEQEVAMQFDIKFALTLLKYRYLVDVNKETLNALEDFDAKLAEQVRVSGHTCIEIDP